MPETANQVEIENSHIQSQQLENTLVTAKFKKLNRTVVISDLKSQMSNVKSQKNANQKPAATAGGQTGRKVYHPTPNRARRIERFLSQAFIVAEVFTGKPGDYTPLSETVRCFREICDGKWDHLPEQAFMYVSTVEDAEARAAKT